MSPELEQIKRLVDAGGMLVANNGSDREYRSVRLWRRGDRYYVGDGQTFTYDFDPAYQVWAELAEKLVEVQP